MNQEIKMEKFIVIWQSLNSENVSSIESVYHQDITFCDPAHHIEGLDNFAHYLTNLYKPLTACSFDITSHAINNDVSFIGWTLSFTHPNFNQAKPVVVDGCSKLIWQDDKIIFHRDFFDFSEMIFEKLPLIGRVAAYIKQQFGKQK